MLMAQMGKSDVDNEPWPASKNNNIDGNKFETYAVGNIKLASFGAGCFWGTEKYYARDFEKAHPGSIIGTSVGFMNPDPNAKPNPSYDEVCEGTTGHIEVVYILYDQSKASFEDLCKHFYTFHDPTTHQR